ncbi:MAG: MMPL family transporter [Nocardiopsaceae bacterium]|jgi:RND superfamily putative drug exporter|nr:MMPL family transporter [Nocardiopsaceae bacterium]
MLWSRWVLSHKWLVVGCWLIALLAGGLASEKVGSKLSQEFALPGEPGHEANVAILRSYGNGGLQQALAAVFRLPPGESALSPPGRQVLAQAFGALTRERGMRVVSFANTGDRRFVSADGRTAFGLVFTPPRPVLGGPDPGPPITASLAGGLPPGWGVRVTGLDELELGAHTQGPAVLTETLLGGLGALVVLAFVFGSLLALVPLLVGATSILTTFLIVYGLTEFTQVSTYVQYLVALIGLGVAIDYSLLLVTRWREERARGLTGTQAVESAMASAGRSVVISGATVAIGLLSMIVLPVPALRSFGYAGMLIPLVSVAVTLSLLPVILAVIGQRLDWPHLRKDVQAGRGWSNWSRGVIRWRWAAVAAALAVMIPLGIAASSLQLGTPQARSLAKSGPAFQGLTWLEQAGIRTGVLTPMEVLAPPGTDPVSLAARLRQVPGVRDAVAPAGPSWRRGGTALVDVQPASETGSPAGKQAIAAVRAAVAGQRGVQVGGIGPEDADFTHAVYGHFPLMLGVIALITFLLLARAFRSVLLPAKAVLLNLLSVGAAYGVVVLVWQLGHGSGVFGVPATGAVEVFVPLLLFAFLYGLSMDYEVFIVARMREAYDRTGSTDAAIVEGVGRTGRLVTSAALVLVLAFASLASGPIVTVKVLATGLGAGILLDAIVLRALLVPALVGLFGRANWWLPRWAGHALRVRMAPQPAAEPDRRPVNRS